MELYPRVYTQEEIETRKRILDEIKQRMIAEQQEKKRLEEEAAKAAAKPKGKKAQ